MTRREAIFAYRAARDEADQILVGYILENPTENLAGLCKEADPDNWNALRNRVQRRLEKTKSEGVSASAISESFKGAVRGAKSGIRKHPELAEALLNDPDVREAITDAVAKDTTATAQVASKTHKEPVRSSAGTDKGVVGLTTLAGLLDELDNAVLVIEDRLPEFTAAVREGAVPNGDAISQEWYDKLTVAASMLELATLETL